MTPGTNRYDYLATKSDNSFLMTMQTQPLVGFNFNFNLFLVFFFLAIHYNSSSRGLAVATSEQIALLQLKNKLVRKIALSI